jgi:hypothetical protein
MYVRTCLVKEREEEETGLFSYQLIISRSKSGEARVGQSIRSARAS